MHCFPASHFLKKLFFVMKFRNMRFTARDRDNYSYKGGTVHCIIKVAGGIVTVIAVIQMVCIRVEFTLKELPGSHFEDRVIN